MYTIMLVNESWIMRAILEETLADSEYKIVCHASTRLELSLTYRLYRPNIVLVDMTRTECNGHQIIQELRRVHCTADIIGLIGNGRDHDALQAILSGASGFLVVPSTDEEFRTELKRIVTNNVTVPPAYGTKSFTQSIRHAIRLLPDLRNRLRIGRAE